MFSPCALPVQQQQILLRAIVTSCTAALRGRATASHLPPTNNFMSHLFANLRLVLPAPRSHFISSSPSSETAGPNRVVCSHVISAASPF
ncbi:unnamed protein product [Periconia digitata]|uniref:Uncharacterized protein n=1 Tax=Periconia digitata TaxID=1303443 RepID=A0A9W4XTZ6_9PLEO|nr:unnamed protein product [Periconia digitata]